MCDESDDEIERKLLARFGSQFDGQPKSRHMIFLDVEGLSGRGRTQWHDEVVERIDDIHLREGISHEKAGRQIADPYLKEHNVQFNSFMSAYYRRKRENAEWEFLEAVSDGDLRAAISAYKTLTDNSKEKFSLN